MHKFSKYHGLGNDFILIDNRNSSALILSTEQAIKICNRNFGVGADGVIFALPGDDESDYTMTVINSDGSIAQMCGNGLRCLALFLSKIEGNLTSSKSYRIRTPAGIIVATLLGENNVMVDMGSPILQSEKIPTLLPITNFESMAIVDSAVEVLGNSLLVSAVSMGNPHAVVFAEELDEMIPPFNVIGPALSKHSSYPEGNNAEFVQVLSRNLVNVKVWERGAGPTLACGTGACAVVVAGVLSGRCDRVCTVRLPGGNLEIEWRESNNRVYMTGPAIEVFEGVITSSIL